MPVAVLDHENMLDERQIDAIRSCLYRIGDDDRARLWLLTEPMLRAIAERDTPTINALVAGAPEGPIRDCLLLLGMPTIAAARAGTLDRPACIPPPPAPFVLGRARPDFLGMFSRLEGTVAPVDVWASRGLYWEKTDADAFAGVTQSRQWHEPVGLDYRHNPRVVLGVSRQWRVDDDGNLAGEFELGSYPVAQHAARAAERHDLGLSMSVRFDTRWVAHPSPAEWSPADGILDVCVRHDGNVEAVALTPAPTYPTATVDRVW
jgi:hypothetical protein